MWHGSRRAYQISRKLWATINRFSEFPQTGVSLRQMVMFGRNTNPGTLLLASSFLMDELPVRLAHRVKELDELPYDMSKMPSIIKVKNWYAQSFEELVQFPAPRLPDSLQRKLSKSIAQEGEEDAVPSMPNPSLEEQAVLEDGVSNTHLTENRQWGSDEAQRKRKPILNYGTLAKFDDIKWPMDVINYNRNFTRCLERIKRRHDATVTTIAQGVLEYKRAKKSSADQADVQTFLDRFYMSRIGIRMLIGQHIALGRSIMDRRGALEYITRGAFEGSVSDVSGTAPEEYVGIICTNTNVGAVAHEAIENARFVCEEHYGLFRAPPVQLVCPKNLTFMYVPSHLNHMLFELLKNSLRAVVERYGTDNEDHFPAIKVIVVEGKEDITIKISDEGGGIPRSEVPLAWTYMYTTAREEDLDPDFQSSDFQAPMAGFGYGLPLARLYARYFGGDLKLISMEGYGTDVYLHLNRLSSSREPLP
ncbi:[pyruvate dehydrogenase (acetyl-transferring)] kinase [Malassezia obtusa]|uniref:Protein-serine/threonine kinase n=1 Tax=Malassezia obtusa TaxID=76774 RepID=A0AAF0E2G7_9BASI|nr:[pyruvate dehydrogenase (acetyl-transferring)] kinase [Malassezia obtusa]